MQIVEEPLTLRFELKALRFLEGLSHIEDIVLVPEDCQMSDMYEYLHFCIPISFRSRPLRSRSTNLVGAFSMWSASGRTDALKGNFLHTTLDVKELEAHAEDIRDKRLLVSNFLGGILVPESSRATTGSRLEVFLLNGFVLRPWTEREMRFLRSQGRME
jgi:hypothetical protein